MMRSLRRVLCCGMLLVMHLSAQSASAPRAFTEALSNTRTGPDAGQAMFLVGVARSAEIPKREVEALQRELMHGLLAQLNQPAAPPAPPPSVWERWKRRIPGLAKPPQDRVTDAVARGAGREDVLTPAFRAAWQTAYNQAAAVRWEDPSARTPFFATEMRDMQPIARGVWAAPAADGGVRLMLALRVANTAARPLPLYQPDVLWPSSPLRFACRWDRAARRQSEMQANEVTLLAPGEVSEPLACEAAPAPGFWRDQLPGLLARNSERPVLVPHDFDNARRMYHLELALAARAPQARTWSERLLAARQQPGRQWEAAERPLLAPESGRWAASPHQGWREAVQRLQWFLGGTVLALMLFGGGRAMRRLGVPQVLVGVGTLVIGGILLVGGTAAIGSGGTGYGHPLYVGLGLWGVAVGPLLLAVLLLHGLYKLLDAENIDWWDTVVRGTRHAFSLSESVSRAEFWGFLALCAWLWVLARLCLAPLDLWIGAALAVPVITLTVRRFRSMSSAQLLEIGLVILCLVLLALI